MNTGFLVSVDLSEGGPPRLGQQLVHLFSFLNMPLLFIIGGSISVLQEECPAARSEFVVNDVKSGCCPLFTSFTSSLWSVCFLPCPFLLLSGSAFQAAIYDASVTRLMTLS